MLIIAAIVLYLNRFLDLNQILFIAMIIVCLVGIYLLYKIRLENEKIQSQAKDIISDLVSMKDNYKELLKLESKHINNCSSNANNSIYKSIEIISDVFNNKQFNNKRLKILKEIIDVIIEKHNNDSHAKSLDEACDHKPIEQ
jgi:hypothetical protein